MIYVLENFIYVSDGSAVNITLSPPNNSGKYMEYYIRIITILNLYHQ